MKSFDRKIWAVAVLLLLLVILGGTAFLYGSRKNVDKAYQLEIKRWITMQNTPPQIHMTKEIQRLHSGKELETEGFQELEEVWYLSSEAEPELLEAFFSGVYVNSKKNYQIRPQLLPSGELGGFYCFLYNPFIQSWNSLLTAAVICLLGAVIVFVGSMAYIRQTILKPFDKMQELPYELAKGRLTRDLKEDKNRLFGKFLWGLDMLRESLEEHKAKEMELQREKKLLLLSLSHDIKTPLSTIRLSVRALKDRLYASEERRAGALDAIEEKASQIEGFVSEIVKMSTTDLISLEMQITEFYLTDLVSQIKYHYAGRLELQQVHFTIGSYHNRMLEGDMDRVLEVIGNLFENAVKYGDGGKIHISFYEEDYRQLIAVENSGESMPHSALVHIFDSFWRGENATGKEGSGLGLYICRQLMREMGGDIYAEVLGTGMKFTIVMK